MILGLFLNYIYFRKLPSIYTEGLKAKHLPAKNLEELNSPTLTEARTLYLLKDKGFSVCVTTQVYFGQLAVAKCLRSAQALSIQAGSMNSRRQTPEAVISEPVAVGCRLLSPAATWVP